MSNRPTIAYQPALDGARAFAVVAVLLFHAGVPGFSGGYLGVSVFFTLSGFLITSLLVHEHDRDGSIDLAAFYARRLRRLLPASVVCLVGVAVIAAMTDLFDGVANLRAHLLGSVFQVANWVFLAGDGSYQDLLARTSGTSSPLEHFWSLAIEEQFYWVWPPVMVVLLARLPHARGRMMAVGGITLATAIAAPVIAQVWGADAAYWSTPARMSEILIGATLAMVLAGRRAPTRVGSLAPWSLAILAFCIAMFPSSSGPAYEGALPLVAIVSASLIVGLQAPGKVRSFFETGGMVWIGKVSYGLYLFHWPVFVIVHPDRFGWPGPVVFVVRIAITLAVTLASYELLEQPVRTHGRMGTRVTFTTAGMATAAVIAVVVATVPTAIGDYWIPDADTAEAAAIVVTDTPLVGLVAPSSTTTTSTTTTSTTTTTIAATPVTASTDSSTTDPPVTAAEVPVILPSTTVEPLPPLARPVRIVVIGDSTAKAIGTGLVNWAAAHAELAQVEVVTAPGCGFLVGGERRTGDTTSAIEGCDGWVETFVYPAVERLQPDVVAAMVTSWDIVDRRWEGDDLLTPFDAAFARRLESDYRALTTQLHGLGAAHVALLRHPIPDVYWLPAADAQEDPARHAVVFDMYDRLASTDDRIDVVAVDRWLGDSDLLTSRDFRPDGIHPTPEASTDLSERYLGDQLIRIALGMERS